MPGDDSPRDKAGTSGGAGRGAGTGAAEAERARHIPVAADGQEGLLQGDPGLDRDRRAPCAAPAPALAGTRKSLTHTGGKELGKRGKRSGRMEEMGRGGQEIGKGRM